MSEERKLCFLSAGLSEERETPTSDRISLQFICHASNSNVRRDPQPISFKSVHDVRRFAKQLLNDAAYIENERRAQSFASVGCAELKEWTPHRKFILLEDVNRLVHRIAVDSISDVFPTANQTKQFPETNVVAGKSWIVVPMKCDNVMALINPPEPEKPEEPEAK